MADLSFPDVRNHVHPVTVAQEAALRRLGWVDVAPSAPEPPAEPAPVDEAPADGPPDAPEIPDLPPPSPSADQES